MNLELDEDFQDAVAELNALNVRIEATKAKHVQWRLKFSNDRKRLLETLRRAKYEVEKQKQETLRTASPPKVPFMKTIRGHAIERPSSTQSRCSSAATTETHQTSVFDVETSSRRASVEIETSSLKLKQLERRRSSLNDTAGSSGDLSNLLTTRSSHTSLGRSESVPARKARLIRTNSNSTLLPTDTKRAGSGQRLKDDEGSVTSPTPSTSSRTDKVLRRTVSMKSLMSEHDSKASFWAGANESEESQDEPEVTTLSQSDHVKIGRYSSLPINRSHGKFGSYKDLTAANTDKAIHEEDEQEDSVYSENDHPYYSDYTPASTNRATAYSETICQVPYSTPYSGGQKPSLLVGDKRSKTFNTMSSHRPTQFVHRATALDIDEMRNLAQQTYQRYRNRSSNRPRAAYGRSQP